MQDTGQANALPMGRGQRAGQWSWRRDPRAGLAPQGQWLLAVALEGTERPWGGGPAGSRVGTGRRACQAAGLSPGRSALQGGSTLGLGTGAREEAGQGLAKGIPLLDASRGDSGEDSGFQSA